MTQQAVKTDACPRCIGGTLFPDEEGSPSCLNCGYVENILPEEFKQAYLDRLKQRGRGRKRGSASLDW